MLCFAALAAGVSGCATPYAVDRLHDAADIFTATVGVGAGAKARIGPIHPGLFANRDFAGLRGGVLTHSFNGGGELGVPAFDIDLTFMGFEGFADNRAMDRGNYYCTDYFEPALFYSLEEPFDKRQRIPFYTQIEAAIAIGPSLRLGFNPGQLLDFIFGLTTVDMFNDDLGRRRTRPKSNKAAAADR